MAFVFQAVGASDITVQRAEASSTPEDKPLAVSW